MREIRGGISGPQPKLSGHFGARSKFDDQAAARRRVSSSHLRPNWRTASLRLPKLDCASLEYQQSRKHKYWSRDGTAADSMRRRRARLPTRTRALRPPITPPPRRRCKLLAGCTDRITPPCRPRPAPSIVRDAAAHRRRQAPRRRLERLRRPKPPSNWSTPRPASARRRAVAHSPRIGPTPLSITRALGHRRRALQRTDPARWRRPSRPAAARRPAAHPGR